MINAIINTHEGLKDDTSLVVVDIMPPGKQFSDCISGRFGSVGGCLCMCVNPDFPRRFATYHGSSCCCNRGIFGYRRDCATQAMLC